MRETIAYKKNFITGEEETSIKMKSDDTSIRGVATIQLFEGDKLIEEHKVENAITDMARKVAFEEYFFRRIMFTDTASTPATPFLYMCLSNYDGEEDTGVLRRYDYLGYAHKLTPYSGDSINRGTVNLAETQRYRKDENGNRLIHYVFDFPTHACNGVINSIFWTNILNNGVQEVCREPLQSGGNIVTHKSLLSSNSYAKVHIINEEELLILNGLAPHPSSGAYKDFKEVIVVDRKTMNIKYMRDLTTVDIAVSGRGVGSTPNSLILCESSTSFREYDFLNHTVKLLNVKLPSDVSGGIWSWGRIYVHKNGINAVLVANGNKIYLGKRSEDNIVFEATHTMNLYTSTTYVGVYGDITPSLVGDDLLILYSDKMVRFNIITGSWVSSSHSISISANHFPIDYTTMELGRIYFNNANSVIPDSLDIAIYRRADTVGAVNKLPTPIHKTSVNTMKVQYDFIVEDVKAQFLLQSGA